MRHTTTLMTAMLATMFAATSAAKLPPPTAAAKAQAVEDAAKNAWTDKVGQYQLCMAGDRVALAYRNSAQAAGKSVAVALDTPPCADPGPYVTLVAPDATRPLEASGAHSPAATAVLPPSTKATAAEIAGSTKK